MRIIPLDVIDDVPYLKADGLHTTMTDPWEIRRECGIYFSARGYLLVDLDNQAAWEYAACAAIS